MRIVAGIGCIRSEIRRLGFTAPDYAVFCYALSHANAEGICWPSIRVIANALHLRQGTVSECVTRIENAGVWRVMRRIKSASIIEFQPVMMWNLVANCVPLDAEKLANCIRGDAGKRQTASLEANEVKNPEKHVARGTNEGQLLEDDFWNWAASLPIMGKALHDHRAIPVTTKRRAKWLLNYAWNCNGEFSKACKLIDEWYSWPWTQRVDERKRSLSALFDSFTEQARLAEFYINERKKFTAI